VLKRSCAQRLKRQRRGRQSARDVLAPLVEAVTDADDARRRAA
jgi:hypothetical protein